MKKVPYNKMIMRLFILLSILYMSVAVPAYSQTDGQMQTTDNLDYATGRVVKVNAESQNKLLQESFGGSQTVQDVDIKILSGKLKGKTVRTQNQLTENPAYDIKVKPNDRVIVDVEKDGSKYNYYLADRERLPALMLLGGVFLMLMLLVGGLKGLKSLASLIITSALMFLVLVPAVLHGLPAVPVTIAVSVVATVFAMFSVGGFTVKSCSATIGTVLGVIIAGLMSVLVIMTAPLSGLHDQESIMLWTSRQDLNFTGILTSAMIIGSLGAIMDIGMTMASCIAEVHESEPSAGIRRLFMAGLNVGRDIMGTMANTLILAYVGSAFPLILLTVNAPLIKLINLNSIATEITSALAGSIGIILCVPITAIISAYMSFKYSKKA